MLTVPLTGSTMPDRSKVMTQTKRDFRPPGMVVGCETDSFTPKKKSGGNIKEISKKKTRARWEDFGQRVALQVVGIRAGRRGDRNTEEWETRTPRSGSGAAHG